MSTPGMEKQNGRHSFYEEFFDRDRKGTLLLLLLVITSLVLFRTYYNNNLHNSVHCASCHMSGDMYTF